MNSRLVKFATLLCFSAVIVLGTSCNTTLQVKSKNAPPGQVKKATGSQSAKPYAPGQQKKKIN